MLLPFQWRRLRQLQTRNVIREWGLELCLRGRFGKGLELTDAQIGKIVEDLKKCRLEALEARMKQNEEIVEEVLDVLTAKQQMVLKTIIGNLQKFMTPSLELMVFQMGDASESKAKFASNLEELRRSSRGFYLRPDGSLMVHKANAAMALDGFIWLCNGKYYGDAEFVSFQHVAILTPDQTEEQKRKELIARMEEIQEKLTSGEVSLEDGMPQMLKVYEEFGDWRFSRFLGKLEKEFLPDQLDLVKVIILRRLISQRGIHACLINGELGKILKVTKGQTRRLRDAAGNRKEKLADLCRQLEESTWNKVKQHLDPKQKSELAKSIGTQPKKLSAAPEFLLSASRSSSSSVDRPVVAGDAAKSDGRSQNRRNADLLQELP